MTLRIGIDVGGTNTDAAVLDGTRVIAQCKNPTTADVLVGVVNSLRHVVADIDPADVASVVVGTTHFVNAITEAHRLAKVVAIRLATPPQSILPFTDWPELLTKAIAAEIHVVAGGHQYDGAELNDADLDQVRRIVSSAPSDQLDFVISSVFAPVNAKGELDACDAIHSIRPDARVTMSHQLGRIGILERENAALLNGALRPLAEEVVDSLRRAVDTAGLDAPLLLSQNDGTVMNLDTAHTFPILTVASGPTNSMRGAALESGESDCVVVDVGGTTTDIGLLQAGFPRQSSRSVRVGDVRTNFRMPDVLSMGIGGGSRVHVTHDGVTVGPDSVGYELTSKALVFGGDQMTLTDVAVASGRAEIGDPSLVEHLDRGLVEEALASVGALIAQRVDQVKLQAAGIPAVLVGGGACLLDETIPGVSKVIRPANSGVANAIGAALANIGCEIDRVYSLVDTSREAALKSARDEAIERAVAAGAERSTVEVVDQEDIPLAHLPGGTATRIRVRVVGDRSLATPAVASDGGIR